MFSQFVPLLTSYGTLSNSVPWNILPHNQRFPTGEGQPIYRLVLLSLLLLLLFSYQVMSDSTWPHGLQHTRLPCPSPSPGACPSSCPFNQWCYTAILSSVALFSFCLQSFHRKCLFQWVSCSHQVAKVLEFQLHHQPFQSFQGWFSLRLTGLISLLSKGLSSPAPQFESTHS